MIEAVLLTAGLFIASVANAIAWVDEHHWYSFAFAVACALMAVWLLASMVGGRRDV